VDPAELAAEAERMTAEEAREAAVLAGLGLTAAVAADAAAAAGPGDVWGREERPGVYVSRASGKPLDTAPGCLTPASFAEVAAGEDDRYPGVSDDELAGVICAWNRSESYVGSVRELHGRRKHAAVAELIR
jgi:hypothetical protein